MTESMFDPQRCGDRLRGFVRGVSTLTIVAPFITVSGVTPILHETSEACRVEIITRWRPEEVASGVSEPQILDVVGRRNGKIWLHPVVHAKLYLTEVRALVGSANVTSNGLGWARPGAAEILVEVPSDDHAILALLTLLRATSAEATKVDCDAVLAAAELLPKPPAKPASSIRDEGVGWLPRYRLPDVLWRVYVGQREEGVAELVRPDLDALGVPSGLRDEAEFNAYVGAILRHGVTGRVAHECSNLTTVRAIERLVEVCADAGYSINDPAETWETLASWIGYFLPNYQRTWGGTRLIG